MTDAQECAEPVEPEHSQLTGEERASLELMLMDQYGIPLILIALELDIACMTEDDQQKVAMEPSLNFLVGYIGQCVSASQCCGDMFVPCQLGIWGVRSTWYPRYWGSAGATTINAALYWGKTNGGSLRRLADCKSTLQSFL